MKFLLIIKKFNRSFVLLFVLLISSAGTLYGQKRNNLEAKRKRLIKEIKLTSNLLNETTRSKEAAFDRFIALQKQIQAREELIQTLNDEVEFTRINIERTAEVIHSLEEDINLLKKEYGQMLRQAMRHKVSQNKLLFLFSSSNFNQMMRRWQYLRQYDDYRKKQARLIVDTRNMLNEKMNALNASQQEKQELLASEQQQQKILSREMEAKDKILNGLKKDESRLRRQLNKQKQNHEKLNVAIENYIKKEMADNRRASRKEPSKSDSKKSIKSPEKDPAIAIGGAFRQYKGKLPWPVESGVITKFFGKQAHPSLKKIVITNNGIDIRTERNASVRAVFEGEVVGTQFIPGYNHMLILKHGNFYTVYSNLKEVWVRRGDQVKAKQDIGRVSLDSKTNKSEVHFELWQNKERLNPVHWISK